MIMTKVMIKIDENDPIWQANEAKMKIPKNPERFPWNPGIKNIGKSRPEKSRDPGIWQDPVPKNPGIEILDPARAWSPVIFPVIINVLNTNDKAQLCETQISRLWWDTWKFFGGQFVALENVLYKSVGKN